MTNGAQMIMATMPATKSTVTPAAHVCAQRANGSEAISRALCLHVDDGGEGTQADVTARASWRP